MWKNKTLKNDAKFHLRGSFSMGLLLLLIVASITFIVNFLVGSSTGFNVLDEAMNFVNEINNYQYLNEEQIAVMGFAFFSKFFKFSMVLGVVTFLLDLFLLQPFDISVKNWFVRNREVADAPGLGMAFKHFGGNFKDLFLGNLWKQLWLFIWGLPSIIAGIAAALVILNFSNQATSGDGVINITVLHAVVMAVSNLVIIINMFFIINRKLAYSMQAYILADNPKFGYKESLNLSKKMMKNNKWHTIGLVLSFIGWGILAAILTRITLGLSAVILGVYTNQTFAELYGALRYASVNRGDVTLEELGFIKQGSEDLGNSFSSFAEVSGQNGNRMVSQNDNLNPYDPDWKNPYANSSTGSQSHTQKLDRRQSIDENNDIEDEK